MYSYQNLKCHAALPTLEVPSIRSATSRGEGMFPSVLTLSRPSRMRSRALSLRPPRSPAAPDRSRLTAHAGKVLRRGVCVEHAV